MDAADGKTSTPGPQPPRAAMGQGALDIAVVGTGIAGMACAWLLSQRHRVTVYEAAPRVGGHSNTVQVPGGPPVDTGFIAYDEATSPDLAALFRHLGVPTRAAEMSFAVSLDRGALEYASTGPRGLFAQRRNLASPRFWAMLRDLLRFHRDAPHDAAWLEAEGTTLGAYLRAQGYHPALGEDHLAPLAAGLWSSPAGGIGDYPAAAFIRGCEAQGLLRGRSRPAWRTVQGGSREYVARLTAPYAARIRTGTPVRALWRDAEGITLSAQDGHAARYDHVVLATSAPQALHLLPDADAPEQRLLGALGTRPTHAVLHTDATLMPRRRAAWAAWNCLGERASGTAPSVTYWMNRLQGLEGATQYFVTLDPPRPPAPGTLLHSEDYRLPMLDAAALAAQRQLWSLQGRRRTWFCGAWLGTGCHEDGLQAGLAVAEALGAPRRPWPAAFRPAAPWQRTEEAGRTLPAALPAPAQMA